MWCRFRRGALVSWLLAGSFGCGADKSIPTVTQFEDATALTVTTPEGLHAELYGSGSGDLLATLDVGIGGAHWLDRHGRLREVRQSAELDLDPSSVLELDHDASLVTWVSAFPQTAAEANELLHRLQAVHSEPVATLTMPADGGQEVPYADYCHDKWDNCTECHDNECVPGQGCFCCTVICCDGQNENGDPVVGCSGGCNRCMVS